MPDDFYHSAELRWFLLEQDEWDPLLKWFRLQDQLPLREEGQYDPKTAAGTLCEAGAGAH